MENSTENQGNKAMPENPKPTDDVQLHIETVIPETEKEPLPKVDEQKEATEEQADEQPQAAANQSDDTEDATSDESSSDAGEAKNEDDQKGDDARDQVETIAP